MVLDCINSQSLPSSLLGTTCRGPVWQTIMTQDALNIGENAVCPSVPPVSVLFHILFDFHPNHVNKQIQYIPIQYVLDG